MIAAAAEVEHQGSELAHLIAAVAEVEYQGGELAPALGATAGVERRAAAAAPVIAAAEVEPGRVNLDSVFRNSPASQLP